MGSRVLARVGADVANAPWLAGTAAMAMALIVATGCRDGAPPAPRTSSPRGQAAIERIAQTAQHAIHADADPTIGCEQCHELIAGEYYLAASWRCTPCHRDSPLAVHETASAESGARECWSCHDFSAASKEPAACASCHDQAQGDVAAIRPHDPANPGEDCLACHRAHETPSLVTTECESCHDQEPVSGHEAPDIQISGCASCHGYHEEPAISSTRCTGCHRQSRAEVSVKATFDKGHDTCATCHQQHRFRKSEVIGCRADCHRDVVVLAEGRAKRHRGCMGCHDQHDVLGSARESCQRCHDEVVAKHPLDRDSKTPCIGCHPPHARAGARTARACSGCHDQADSDRGLHQSSAQRGPTCRDCHRPHGFGLRSAGSSLCGSCHGSKPFVNAGSIRTHAKHRDCLACHGEKVAHAPTGPRVACASCHQEEAAVTHKDHRRCVSCHDPHTTAQRQPCGSCHEKQARAARKEHKNCVGCHEPHATAQKTTCSGCHEAQARSASPEHRDCMQCHDEHSTRVTKACAQCHKDRTAGVHARVKGRCRSCHRAHGPGGIASPPACTSCHTRAPPAQHASPGHRDCKSCHRSHGAQPYRRPAACLSCHEEMKDHEPTATMCIGCHAFGGYE